MSFIKSAATGTAIALFGAATFVATPANASKPKLVKVSVGHSTSNHRPLVPTLHVKYSNGKWRLQPTKVYFDLSVYAKVKRGGMTRVKITVPATGTAGSPNSWVVWSSNKQRRKAHAKHTKRTIHSSYLGELGRKAVRMCESSAPGGMGTYRPTAIILVKISVKAYGLRMTSFGEHYLSKKAGLKFRVYCEGKPAAPRAANNPTRAAPKFRLTGGWVKLTKIGTHCPRTVFAQVNVIANKSGKVRYTLRSSSGARWHKTVFVQTRTANGSYKASYDHRFTVKKSLNRKYWIEVGGKKIGRPSFLKVVCLSDRPNGLAN